MTGLLVMLMLAQPPAAEEVSTQVLQLKRVFIDKFLGPDSAAQLRDMLISSLQRARLFVITENPERADAVLRGSGEDLIFTDTFQSGDSLSADAGVSLGRGTSTRSRDSASLRGGVRESDSTRIAERKHEASLSVRLVNKDGDIIWSTTQESQGAKFRSASADVAEKAARQLVQDIEKVRNRVN